MSNDINQALGMAGGSAHPAGRDPGINAALRYQESYRSARMIRNMGLGIKIFGGIAAFLQFSLLMSLTGSNPYGGSRIETTFLFFALLISVIMGAMFFALGVIVSALGEHLRATLDSAVNSSPFLDVPAKARAMSL